jgi:hypothetical protein
MGVGAAVTHTVVHTGVVLVDSHETSPRISWISALTVE